MNNNIAKPSGHNLNSIFYPPFYAFRKNISQIKSLGGLSVKEACFYFHTSRIPYTYSNIPTYPSIRSSNGPTLNIKTLNPSLVPSLIQISSSDPSIEPTNASPSMNPSEVQSQSIEPSAEGSLESEEIPYICEI